MTRMITTRDKAVLNAILDPFNMKNDSNQIEDLDDNITYENVSESVRIAKSLQLEGIKLADCGNLYEAVDKFTSAINVAPELASPYNDRAQTYRLLQRNMDAMNDLNRAINLTQKRGRVAMQALTQRAMLHQVNGDENAALADYKVAANLGCGFAQTQVVALNPYAALCSQMLTEVFGKLKNPQSAREQL